MTRTKGPGRPELAKKILEEVRKKPEGIWIRKLARKLKEPVTTVHRYVTINENGYPGEKIKIIKQLPQELGGHIMIKLKNKI